MTAEPGQAFLVKPLPLSYAHGGHQGYYRSKLFVVPFSANPLACAASPLFSLLERLCISPSLPPIANIRENIEHELRAFHSHLQSSQYTQEFFSLAHYLLSATIDEMVGKSYLKAYGSPIEFQAFTSSSQGDVGPEHRFFDIIYYIKERPNQYLDLIELAYYCLIAGFEGREHMRPDGRLVLDNLIEALYQLIQDHRVNKPHKLFRDEGLVEQPSTKKNAWKAMAIASLSALILAFFVSDNLILNQARVVQLSHPVMAALEL